MSLITVSSIVAALLTGVGIASGVMMLATRGRRD
jgi:hypothetical protein